MKKILGIYMRMLTIIIMLFIGFGCQKVSEYFNYSGNGATDIRVCRIKQISVGGESGAINYNFSYNKNGDPVSVINNRVGTGNPNMYFKYDKYGRLVEMIRPYVNGAYETWDKYIYNNKNQIVKDSSYGFGAMGSQGPLPANHFTIVCFEYDTQGRVIRLTDSLFYNEVFNFAAVYQYAYDVSGNLIHPNSNIIYDSKLNFLKTNKVWMFISKDYSLNNPFIANSYNEIGLPLCFPASYTSYTILAPLLYGGSVNKIIYDCN